MILLFVLLSGTTHAAPLPAKTITTVQSPAQGEEIQENAGFGDKAGEVKMMNLMMVAGSGYEGMDMAQAEPAAKDHSTHADTILAATKESNIVFELVPSKAKMGKNTITFTATDSKTKKPVAGLKLQSEVYMTTMDMGTEHPKVKDPGKGKYQVKADFSMRGPWGIRLMHDSFKQELTIEVQ